MFSALFCPPSFGTESESLLLKAPFSWTASCFRILHTHEQIIRV